MLPKNQNEAKIVSRFIDDALAAGYSLSVFDGLSGEGEEVVTKSKNRAAIIDAIYSTDSDVFEVWDNDTWLGNVGFIWGNDVDCLYDYHVSDKIDALLGGTMTLTEDLMN